MINRTEVEVGLQLSVGTLYLSNQIVIIPCGLLIYVPYICAKEVYTTVLVYVLWYGYAPPDVLHILRLILVTLIFYHIIFGDGRILSDDSANTLYDFFISLFPLGLSRESLALVSSISKRSLNFLFMDDSFMTFPGEFISR